MAMIKHLLLTEWYVLYYWQKNLDDFNLRQEKDPEIKPCKIVLKVSKLLCSCNIYSTVALK